MKSMYQSRRGHSFMLLIFHKTIPHTAPTQWDPNWIHPVLFPHHHPLVSMKSSTICLSCSHKSWNHLGQPPLSRLHIPSAMNSSWFSMGLLLKLSSAKDKVVVIFDQGCHKLLVESLLLASCPPLLTRLLFLEWQDWSPFLGLKPGAWRPREYIRVYCSLKVEGHCSHHPICPEPQGDSKAWGERGHKNQGMA